MDVHAVPDDLPLSYTLGPMLCSDTLFRTVNPPAAAFSRIAAAWLSQELSVRDTGEIRQCGCRVPVAHA
jgi:hypothetical protein